VLVHVTLNLGLDSGGDSRSGNGGQGGALGDGASDQGSLLDVLGDGDDHQVRVGVGIDALSTDAVDDAGSSINGGGCSSGRSRSQGRESTRSLGLGGRSSAGGARADFITVGIARSVSNEVTGTADQVATGKLGHGSNDVLVDFRLDGTLAVLFLGAEGERGALGDLTGEIGASADGSLEDGSRPTVHEITVVGVS
jgi:hypothetical protein